jgi:holin-like protein
VAVSIKSIQGDQGVLPYITLLLVCQLIGEVVVRLLHLPIPGPVVGMVVLFAGLVARGRAPEELEGVAGGLLRYLSLLFVPAGTGVIVHAKMLSTQLAPVAGTVAIGTAVTVGVTGWLMQRLRKGKGHG